MFTVFLIHMQVFKE